MSMNPEIHPISKDFCYKSERQTKPYMVIYCQWETSLSKALYYIRMSLHLLNSPGISPIIKHLLHVVK